jgi:hypothetical protein
MLYNNTSRMNILTVKGIWMRAFYACHYGNNNSNIYINIKEEENT